MQKLSIKSNHAAAAAAGYGRQLCSLLANVHESIFAAHATASATQGAIIKVAKRCT